MLKYLPTIDFFKRPIFLFILLFSVGFILGFCVAKFGIKNNHDAISIREYDIPHKSYEISAKKYALFFRVLYNGTLLSREMSNKAILLLNEVEFDKGLRAGTPENIQVAHKYGINAVSEGKGYKVELSDCGIVYSKPSPYLLCVYDRR